MARSSRSSSGAEPPVKFELKTNAVNISIRIPHRKLTLLTITLLLNTLLWSSIICIIVCIFQVVSDPDDKTNIAPVVLTLTSAIATIFYTTIHTVFSMKQRIWSNQQQNPTAIKNTTYIAIRTVASLCVLWLLTSGWNMIIVARRPICAKALPGLQGWEYGPTCHASRVSTAFAMIALVASFILFGTLNTARRPFEAHLIKHGYRQETDDSFSALGSNESSPVKGASEKNLRVQRRSKHRTAISDVSNADVNTMNLNRSLPPAMIYAPSPVRSISTDIFTSSMTPPPIPSAYTASPRASSLDLPYVFPPAAAHSSLTRPPRLSGFVATPGFVPLSVPVQYSASAWRAVHPAKSSPLRPISRSHPHLRNAAYSSPNRYSRSSISLTRPHRLSTASPIDNTDFSSRSESTGPESTSGDDIVDGKPSAKEIAYAILHGTPIPGTTTTTTTTTTTATSSPVARRTSHTRTCSAPDTKTGAQQPHSTHRMAKGWKPRLPNLHLPPPPPPNDNNTQDTNLNLIVPEKPPITATRLLHSHSAGFLSRFSPDTSPESDTKKPCFELEAQLAARDPSTSGKARSWSADESTHKRGGVGEGVDPAYAARVMLSRMPGDIRFG